ncbi:hypothetical protein HNQ50_003598 [Silvimonas terrae]|uniref:Uncharacterized protein n=1 Tax=Silvimonas terrae TaxID=300266 RepID=A0A840RJT3_9NEIS|nr:hypothetical protein [Silvimonas terrae]
MGKAGVSLSAALGIAALTGMSGRVNLLCGAAGGEAPNRLRKRRIYMIY